MAIACKKRIEKSDKTLLNLVMYRKIFKRLLDVLVAIMVLVVMFPIIFVASLILLFQNKGKVIFFQERPGLHQKAFRIVKLKTMTDEKDSQGKLLPDNQRITKAGKIIRKLSIDELPQLINVLNGDMSLVGPRPLLFKYIPLYTENQLRRHEVRPGITGWAQVNGRNSITWTKKFELDIYYVDNISIILDIKILWMTFLKVIQREGINQSEVQPMQPFDGTN